jgi:hypothetical protein
MEFCKANGFDKIEFGTGKNPSCNPKCKSISKRSPITIWSNGQLSIKLSWLADTEIAKDFRDRLQNKLRQAGLPSEYLPNQTILVDMNDWMQWVDQLLEAMRSAAEEVLHPEHFPMSADRLSRFGDSGDEIGFTWTIKKAQDSEVSAG